MPARMSSQLVRRASRAVALPGRRSPSARMPTATPVTMDVTAAAVHTCAGTAHFMSVGFELLGNTTEIAQAIDVQSAACWSLRQTHHEAVAILQATCLQRKAARCQAHAGGQSGWDAQRLPRRQQEPRPAAGG